MHKVDRRAARGGIGEEPGDDRVQRVGEVVVAGPELEQVAENLERGRARGFALHEGKERLVGGRALAREMEVGDEERARHGLGARRGAYFFAGATSEIDSITTWDFGTSPEPVGVSPILITTSMPDTTLPNTA